MKKTIQRCISAGSMLVVLCLAQTLYSQTANTGALTGTVTDASGAVIANATVAVTNTGTGQVRTVTTGTGGIYRVNLLPPGSYSIQFASQGFQQDQVNGVNVNVTEARVVDANLKVGASVESVHVSDRRGDRPDREFDGRNGPRHADRLRFAAEHTELHQSVELSAGAAASVTNANSLGKGSQGIAVNGSGTNSNTYQIGAALPSTIPPPTKQRRADFGSMAIPNPDSIQEFKNFRHPRMMRALAANPGANVNVVTKGGTEWSFTERCSSFFAIPLSTRTTSSTRIRSSRRVRQTAPRFATRTSLVEPSADQSSRTSCSRLSAIRKRSRRMALRLTAFNPA